MRSQVITAGIGVLLVTLGLSYSHWRIQQAEASRAQAPAPPVPVEVAKVKLIPFVDHIEAVGTIAARRDVMVSSEAAGRVVQVRVEVGDRVQQGTVIAEVDPELRRLAVEQAEAQLALAAGLQEGDLVVTLGQQRLSEGAAVASEEN